MKTNFENYIESNQKLMDCFEKVPVNEFQSMSEYDQENLCANQKNEVKKILESGKMSFSQILHQKIEVMQDKESIEEKMADMESNLNLDQNKNVNKY